MTQILLTRIQPKATLALEGTLCQGHITAIVTANELLIFAHRLMILYICTKFAKISKRVSELLS